MIARKIYKNYWLVISLFIGILVTIILVSSIPIYTTGSLQKLVVSESERYQENNGTYPGIITHQTDWEKLDKNIDRVKLLEQLEKVNEKVLDQQVEMPKVEAATMLTSKALKGYRGSSDISMRNIHVVSLTNFEENIKLLHGNHPTNSYDQKVIEVYIHDNALLEMDIFLGEEIRLTDRSLEEDLIVRPVGTFQAAEGTELYWPVTPNRFENTFFVAENIYREQLLPLDEFVKEALIYSTYDYTNLNIKDASRLLPIQRLLRNQTIRATENTEVTISSPMIGIVQHFLRQEGQFRAMTITFFTPVLVMLLIYLWMVAKLIVERQHAEIAVLRSRGAGKRQVAFIYFIEAVFLCGIAILIGPLIGLMISKMLGSTTGFMEFVQRQSLPVKLTLDTYLYAGVAAIACLISVMIPVFMATRQNIVSQKRQHSRGHGQAIWHKYFIDILLLAIAAYGWYMLRQTNQSTSESQSISIDPLLLLVPVLFIIGFTLLAFRVYPWIIALIAWMGRKKWPVPLYTTLMQIGRSSQPYQFFMLFLVMTISIGLFSANTAQIVNQNLEEQVRYQAGADIVLQQFWDRDIPIEMTKAGEMMSEEDKRDNLRILYYEPDTSHFNDWPGVKQVAKVFQKSGASITNTQIPNNKEETHLMGIDTKTFGETAFFRSSLLSPNRHWYEYLNLMASENSAVFLSKALAEKLEVLPGEYVTLNWNMAQQAHFVVYDVIDYWPSWDPSENPYFVVGNLSYIQTSMAIEPYQLWISLEDDADRSELMAKIEEEELSLFSFRDIQKNVNDLSNDAYLTGLNGSLTLGFLIALVITFIGFLLYWVLSLRARSLQYGTFRALGMSARQLFSILWWEQVLTTGVAIMLGVVAGKITSFLFIPFIQYSLGGQKQILPFRIFVEARDELLIYCFAAVILIIGLAILSWMVSKIKIHQAIKIGEE